MNILVTGAAGKTGKEIIRQLNLVGHSPSIVIHSSSSLSEVNQLTISSIHIGDIGSPEFIDDVFSGVDIIYLIMPNMYSSEDTVGRNIISTASRCNVKKIVYHSVLHPQTEAMPHHWKKCRVEEALVSSSIRYTILQPTAYMQNLLGYKNQINSGLFAMPYHETSMISLVDLMDVSEVAAKVLSDQDGWSDYATYELVGSNPLSQIEVAQALSRILCKPITASHIPHEIWEQQAAVQKLPDYTRATLKSMFSFYSQFGLKGSPDTLTKLLGRAPTSLDDFLNREYIK
jgi:uncharacterized protein YbjT (DUF2867 family)